MRIRSWLRQNVHSELDIGRSALQDYVAKRRRELHPKEAFIRTIHTPGEQAQFDFSPMKVILHGKETVVEFFFHRLSYSGRFFLQERHFAAIKQRFSQGYLKAIHFLVD